MGNFLTTDFWFSLRPGAFIGSSLKVVLGFIVFLIAMTVVAGFIKRRWAKSLYAGFWNSLYTFFLANAVIGAFLTFFNYEMVPFLSARFWFLIWAVGLIVWLVFVGKMLVKIPQKKALLEKEKEFRKYVP